MRTRPDRSKSKRLFAAASLLMALGSAGPAWSAALSWELSSGYRHPASAEFREIYGGGFTFAGQLDLRLTERLSAWAGAEYFGKTGTIMLTGEETKIRIVPLTAGLKMRLITGPVSPYLAAGAGYILYKEENVVGTLDGGVFGVVGQAGVLIKVARLVSIDVYARYWTGKTKAEEPDVLAAELGGLQGGVGLVVGF